MFPRLPKYCTFVRGNDCGEAINPGQRERAVPMCGARGHLALFYVPSQHLREVRQSLQATI